MHKLIVIFLLFIGSTLLAQNKPVVDSLTQLLKTERTDTTRVNLYNQLAWEYRNSNIQLTDSFAALAISEGSRLKFYKGTGNAYINMAFVYRSAAQYQQAIEACRWALVQFVNSNHRLGYASAYNSIASIHYLMGNFPLAQFYFFKSHKISVEMGDHKGVARTYINLGTVLTEQQKYDKALAYLQHAAFIFDSLDDAQGKAVCLNNMGSISQLTGKQDSAIRYYQQSVTINRSIGDLKSVAVGLHNIATIYSQMGDHREAISYYHQSLAIDEKLGNIPSIVVTYGSLAHAYYGLSMYHTAAGYCQKSLDLAIPAAMRADITNAYELLYLIEEKRGKFKEAFEYHKLYKQYSDSIYNEEASIKVTELEEQYLNERLEKQRILAAKEGEIMLVRAQEKENAVTQYIFIIGLVLIIFVSFMYIVFFLLRRTKNS